jgi:PKD repeat protein
MKNNLLRLNHYKLMVLLVFLFTNSYSQNYCTPSHSGTGGGAYPGAPSSFFTHILNVTLGSINFNSNPPFFNPTANYNNLTFISTDLTQTVTYPMSITLGNGANPQTVVVWVDFNQNRTFESSERILAKFDSSGTNSHIITANLTVPVNAKLGPTRMRVGTRYSANPTSTIPDPCVNNDLPGGFNWSQHFQDYTVNIVSQSTQVFLSTTTTQANQNEVTKGSTNNVIIGVEVVTNSNGTLSPLTAGNFDFSTIGTTNPSEISNAKLFYTGVDPVFNTSTLVGTPVATPSNGFVINANTKLKPGRNHFWLTFDVSATAILKNVIDARCNSVVVSQPRIPNVVSPPGNREVGYCVSAGNQSWFVNITRVTLADIFNSPPFNNNLGYNDFTNFSTNLQRNAGHLLYLKLGNGVNPAYKRGWIDYNHDGDFTDAGEMIFDSTFYVPPPNPQVQDTNAYRHYFVVPAGAKVGPTRMRLSVQSAGGAAPCTNPVQIGEVEDYSVLIEDAGEAVADFGAPTVCLGASTNFNDISYTFGAYTVDKWTWNFGDPSSTADTSSAQYPSYTYTTPGVYNVTLTVNTNKPGTPATVTKAVIVEYPAAAFSYKGTLAQSLTTFIDASTGGLATGWEWDFGDPQSGPLNNAFSSNPGHVFDTAGTYAVSLIVTTSGGCRDTIVQNIVIKNTITPVADYTASTYQPYVGQPVNLVDQSLYNPTTWEWTITPSTYTFLSGTSANSPNPVIAFNALTTYTVKQKVINSAGSDSVSKLFITKNYIKPVADFTGSPLTVKAGQSVAFIDLSSNDPSSWLWDFGDTTSGLMDTSTMQHPFHQYNNPGSYHVTLTSTNPAGSGSKTVNNYVLVTDDYNLCDNSAVSSPSFTGTIYDSGGPNFFYNNGSNCGFLIKPACSGPITLTFLSFSMDAGDFLKVYDGIDATGIPLFPGSGFTGTTIPPVLTSKSGTFYIEEVTNNTITAAGFQAYWQAAPNVKPVAALKADSIGYIDAPFRLLNKSTAGTGNIYYWDLDDDGTNDFIGPDAIFFYKNLGMQRIRLVAQNCLGADTIYHFVNIKIPTGPPVIEFEADKDTVAQMELLTLVDISSNGPTKWLWQITPSYYTLVNGTTDSSFMPQMQFYLSGYFTVCLTATNAAGSATKCIDKFLLVKENSLLCTAPFQTDVVMGDIYDSGGQGGNYINNANCGTAVTPCAEKLTLYFTAFNYAAGDYLRVYDGIDNTGTPLFTGLGFTGTQSPGTLVSNSGTLYIEEVTNAGGTAQGFEAYWVSTPSQTPSATFSAPDTAYTGGSITNFYNLSTGNGLVYAWDFETDGIIDQTSRDGDYTYLTPGHKVATLEAENCVAKGIHSETIVVVNPSFKPKIAFGTEFTRPSTSDVVLFKDSSTQGPNTWTWTFTPNTITYLNGTDSSSKNPQVKFNVAGAYDVCLKASNSIGVDNLCKTSYIVVLNYCQPTAGFSNDIGIAKVAVRNLNNISGIAGGYTDYTSNSSVTLERRSVNPITIERITTNNPQNVRVWIDYNQDGDFTDQGENILTFSANSSVAVRDSFTVPASATLGSTRMRIGAALNVSANSPCGPIGIGEYEDYKVFIINDVEKPVITLLGITPDSVEAGKTYPDKGAIAWDEAERNITNRIVTLSNLNNQLPGTYQIKYNVSDSAGNAATEVIRTVKVTADKSKPVISLLGSDPYEHAVKFSPFTDPGATGYDSLDGNITPSLVFAHNVDVNKVGTYQAWYHLSDNNGNKADSVVRTVLVVDTVPPVITRIGAGLIHHPQYQQYTDLGATVNDNYYLGLVATPTYNPPLNVNIPGTYILTYNATDSSGNKAIPVTRVIEVETNIGLEELVTGGKIEIFPNPASDKIWVKAGFNEATEFSIKVMSVMGKELLAIPLMNGREINQQIDLSGYAAGVYYLRIQTGNELITRKITVAR